MDKNQNNEVQRMTYSGQKKRHFVRPFTLCCADGRIIDLYGPYYALNNDASIFLDIFEKEESLMNLLNEEDFVVLDRGFRDCAKELKSKYKLNVLITPCEFIFNIIFTK